MALSKRCFLFSCAGKNELCAQVPDDFSYGVTLNARLANPYMSIAYGFVSKPDLGAMRKRLPIALAKNTSKAVWKNWAMKPSPMTMMRPASQL
jgi:hypothetical protein